MPGGEVTLLLNRPEGDVQLPGVWRDSGEGWSNGAEIGKADAPLKRIVAHWFNLPDFRAGAGPRPRGRPSCQALPSPGRSGPGAV
jgi:hypothetical protein